MPCRFRLASVLALIASGASAHAQVERVWLTHQSNDPSRIVVNWETAKPLPSVVNYGLAAKYDRVATTEGLATRHHVEIAIPEKDVVWHYSVGSGEHATKDATFKGYPVEELRVAIVGDWGYAPGRDLSALKKDDVHLLITAGDNVPSLHEKGREGVKAFADLIDREPELFRGTPFMPILGNHDKEVKSRGPKPPPEAVYDVSATAYREFFALPGDEWKWHFDIPEFDVRFIATDIQHISDIGNTWQTCHAIDAQSEQFVWFRDLMGKTAQGFVFSLINEKQSSLAGATKGIWHEQFRKSSALITGFGYFAERAELDGGLPYFNTCLKGDGSPYKDAKAQFFKSEDNYLLLTFKKGAPSMTVQFKNLLGEVLDTRVIEKRKP
ncbi:calcineurin-like phosphoesterase family protein [Roseimicrobium gellanilyticum]|uniref:Calcineurin-like phosphoesterase family protein n=1 Tax=Roseimicrobium gellanilyticum TaxID=748857 RepID=A0A366H9W0_9BACT|nr:metallophosphoesterase [Roseimicrobium gellanilyticum]RBP39081.1 calcineurin-like phosphoesterase family protein [Roseimicrobium gellanilyticum]